MLADGGNSDTEMISEWPVKSDEGYKPKGPQKSKQDDLQRRGEPGVTLVPCKVRKAGREQLASVTLAKWWRRCGKDLIDRKAFPVTNNAHTLLSFISRTPEGRQYMRDEVRRLKLRLGNYKGSSDVPADILAALGSHMARLGQYEEATRYLQEAVKLCPEDKDYWWLLHKVKHQQCILTSQTDALCGTYSTGSLKFPLSTEVERVSASSLSLYDFFTKYASTSTPVIITDMVCTMTKQHWDTTHIRNIAGDCKVVLKQPVDGSLEWARLEDCCTVTVKEFIDEIGSTHSDKYLFDWSLPLHCPALAQQLTVPRYFAGDFLQRTSPGSLYRDSWPSLFIAGPGLHSDLHIDAFGSNFWMALFQGKKRWIFFPPEDLPFLYPKYEHSFDPVFDVNLIHPDLGKFPLLALTHPRGCVLQPGELLFVPAGCPHRVENLETSVAISANYVDLSNFDKVKTELKINSLSDPRSEDLLKQFESDKFDTSMSFQLENLSFAYFKSGFKNTK